MLLQRFLSLLCVLVIAAGVVLVDFPEGIVAVAFVFALAAIVILAIRRYAEEKEFLIKIFLIALALRMALGVVIQVFELREFFGADALGYDANAAHLVDVWMGRAELTGTLRMQNDPGSGSFWGMYYLTASIYYFLGHNIFAAQSFFAVIGAATAPMVYYCSKMIYDNIKVAKFAAVAVAIFPSFVVWSGQLLKDGLMIFFLVTIMTMVLQLQKKFSYYSLGILLFSLFGILSLRFYIFYMVVVAVGGSFVIGVTNSNRSVLRNTVILVMLGLALTMFGIGKRASIEYEIFGNLDRVQTSRSDLAKSANSGFNRDSDVSTAEGALSAIPEGFAYLYFAPFPWEAANLRQAITIPEVLTWWAMIPFLVYGLMYTIRNKLRTAFPILIFSLLLTLAYSVFQGNVGTAYRQRTQIQVFLFILVAVGWRVFQENRENERIIRAAAQREIDDRLRAGRLAIERK